MGTGLIGENEGVGEYQGFNVTVVHLFFFTTHYLWSRCFDIIQH